MPGPCHTWQRWRTDITWSVGIDRERKPIRPSTAENCVRVGQPRFHFVGGLPTCTTRNALWGTFGGFKTGASSPPKMEIGSAETTKPLMLPATGKAFLPPSHMMAKKKNGWDPLFIPGFLKTLKTNQPGPVHSQALKFLGKWGVRMVKNGIFHGILAVHQSSDPAGFAVFACFGGCLQGPAASRPNPPPPGPHHSGALLGLPAGIKRAGWVEPTHGGWG